MKRFYSIKKHDILNDAYIIFNVIAEREYTYYPFYNKKLARKLVRKMNESMNNISQYNLQKIYKEYIHTIEYKRIIMNFPYYRKRMK